MAGQDFADAQDATAEALAKVLTATQDGDTLISAQALRTALATLGVPIAIRGLASAGDEVATSMYFGMSQVVELLMNGLELVIAHSELESL